MCVREYICMCAHVCILFNENYTHRFVWLYYVSAALVSVIGFTCLIIKKLLCFACMFTKVPLF